MAVKPIYEVLRLEFDDEKARSQSLESRARVYLVVATFFLGGLAFKLNYLFEGGTDWPQICLFMSVALFAISFLLIVSAIGIYSYEGLFDPHEVIGSFEDDYPTEDSFYEDRIVDIAVAYSRNSPITNKRSNTLAAASVAMWLGILTAFTGVAGIALDSGSNKEIECKCGSTCPCFGGGAEILSSVRLDEAEGGFKGGEESSQEESSQEANREKDPHEEESVAQEKNSKKKVK